MGDTLVFLLFINGRLRGAFSTYAAACAKGASVIGTGVKLTILTQTLDAE